MAKLTQRLRMVDVYKRQICEKIIPFDELPKQLWLRFDTMEDYKKNESRLLETIRELSLIHI